MRFTGNILNQRFINFGDYNVKVTKDKFLLRARHQFIRTILSACLRVSAGWY